MRERFVDRGHLQLEFGLMMILCEGVIKNRKFKGKKTELCCRPSNFDQIVGNHAQELYVDGQAPEWIKSSNTNVRAV